MQHDALHLLVEAKKDDLITLCSEMIRIPSINPPGVVDEIIRYICAYLDKHGIPYEIVSGNGETKNIVARLGKKGGRVLLLNGHCDVVPVGNAEKWEFDPFGGEIKD